MALMACREEPLREEPVISLISAGPDTIEEFVDSITVVISYEDLDGDLGQNNTDDNNLFARDLRADITYGYRIQQLVPGGAQVPIRGELRFAIKNLFRLDTLPMEEVNFNIYCQDRAGHTSNAVRAGPFYLVGR